MANVTAGEKIRSLQALGVRYPVMQPGMPVAGPVLAAAVAQAGGIGTLGMTAVENWDDNLAATSALVNSRPFCAHLLLPYVRPEHVASVIRHKVPMVSLFWGDRPDVIAELKAAGIFVFQQVGSVTEAERVLGQGVDAVIAQGKEAGGHVRAHQYLRDFLPAVAAAAGNIPVLAAGGMYTRADVARAISLGAVGVSTGTRFVLSHESLAHDRYKDILLGANETLLTELFALSWPAPHRVVPNAATDRWCGPDGDVPQWLRAVTRRTGKLAQLLPMKSGLARAQHPVLPFYTPAAPLRGLPSRLADCSALYAGEAVGQINALMSAKDIVEELAAGLSQNGSSEY